MKAKWIALNILYVVITLAACFMNSYAAMGMTVTFAIGIFCGRYVTLIDLGYDDDVPDWVREAMK